MAEALRKILVSLSAVVVSGWLAALFAVGLSACSNTAPPVAAPRRSSAYAASALSTRDVYEIAKITVHVTAQPRGARALPSIPGPDGAPVTDLSPTEAGKTVDVLPRSYIVLRFPIQALGYVITPARGIVETPSGLYHMPRGVIGLLRAINPGTAIISIRGLRSRTATLSKRRPKLATGPNWSGYATTTGAPFTEVTATWQVPTVQGDAGCCSSTWAGIDGDGSNTVIQTGTDQNWSSDILDGGAQYDAWYELFPASSVSLPYTVLPGDQMSANIFFNGTPTPGSPMSFTIVLNNLTRGWNWSTIVSYAGNLVSAEWIEEAPDSCDIFNNCSVSPLSDFGTVTLESATATPSSVLSTSGALQIVQGSPAFFATPSDPEGDGDGFRVAFGQVAPHPPGPFIITTVLSDAILNQTYQQAVQVIQDSDPTWQFVGGSLPAGLHFNSVQGVVEGTPTASGSSTFTVVAGNQAEPAERSPQQSIALTVLSSATQPPPSPTHSPRGCPSGKKCCETDAQGNCIKCVSANESCP